MSKLHLLSGNNVVATIELTGELIAIGRTEKTELCIEDDSISKQHGVFVRDGDDYQIHDFNSTNGTWVNGERIMAVKLKHGDRLRIGHVHVLYDAAVLPSGPKVKLSGGAKLLEQSPVILAELTPQVPPAPSPAEPAQPVRRTLGGKTLEPVSEAGMTLAAAKRAVPPVTDNKATEDRVFINIPDSPAPSEPESPQTGLGRKPRRMPGSSAPAPTQVGPSLRPPSPSLLRHEPEAEPADQNEYTLTPVPAELIPEFEPAEVEVDEAQETVVMEPLPQEAATEVEAEAPPVADVSLETAPASEPVERKLQTTATGSKGEVTLRQAPPAGGGERKLSPKPSAQSPREHLRFGPAKKTDQPSPE